MAVRVTGSAASRDGQTGHAANAQCYHRPQIGNRISLSSKIQQKRLCLCSITSKSRVQLPLQKVAK